MIRYATRNAIDRVDRALQNLSEKLDLEPDSDFQRAVDEMRQMLQDAEAEHHKETRAAA